jgi:ATP-dependent RNA helicase DeaD
MSKKEVTNFNDFGLKESLMEGIIAAGFKVPSEIQQQAIPVVMTGADVIGQAHTGTGKTAAFGLPAMHRMDFKGGIEMLVIVPTRELAVQVSDEIYRLGRFAGVKTGTVLGGQSYTRQIKMINEQLHVLVATPGRLLDLLESNKFRKFLPSIVVLDEADEMLDMGFLDDIKAIFEFLPEYRQTLLFSATMPAPIQKLAEQILHEPVTIKTIESHESTNQDIEQLYCVIEEREREDAVIRLMDDQAPEKAILFCRTRTEVDRLSNSLGARGFNAKGLHGDMEQPQRNRVMQGFRDGQIDILIATDVASRGLDVMDVSHVFNYHMPFDTKSYIHRVGRTGRAGKKGTAITLVTPMEFNQMERIQRQTGANIEMQLIPSLSEMRMNKIVQFSDDLRKCEISPEAVALVDSLKLDMDMEEIARKLATLFMEDQQGEGPERIGISGEKLERIIRAEKQRKKSKFKDRRKRFGNSRKPNKFKDDRKPGKDRRRK